MVKNDEAYRKIRKSHFDHEIEKQIKEETDLVLVYGNN